MTVSFATVKGHFAKSWKSYVGLAAVIACIWALVLIYTVRGADREWVTDAVRGLRGGSTGGLTLAYFGVLLLVAAQVYTLVKRTGDSVLSKKMGGAKLWLNIHIVLSLAGLIAIALHAGLQYQFRYDRLFNHAYAGLAMWLLLLVTVNGVFGRYIYRRLPAFKRAFRVWKPLHLAMTGTLFLFALIHIVAA